MLQIAFFSQNDSRWRSDRHGTSNSTLGATGCTITALTSILVHAGYNETPKTVNTKLTKNGGYAQGNLIIWQAVQKIWPKVQFVRRLYQYNNDVAVAQLKQGLLPLIEVNAAAIGGAPGGKHWVLFLGDKKSHDPWPTSGNIKPTSTWTPTGMAIYQYTPKGADMPDDKQVTIAEQLFAKLVGNSTKWDNIVKYLGISTDPAATTAEKAIEVVEGIRSWGKGLEKKLAKAEQEVNNREEQVSRLKEQLLTEQNLRNDLETKLKRALQALTELPQSYEGTIAQLQAQVDETKKEAGALKIEITQKDTEIKQLKDKITAELSLEQLLALLLTKLRKIVTMSN